MSSLSLQSQDSSQRYHTPNSLSDYDETTDTDLSVTSNQPIDLRCNVRGCNIRNQKPHTCHGNGCSHLVHNFCCQRFGLNGYDNELEMYCSFQCKNKKARDDNNSNVSKEKNKDSSSINTTEYDSISIKWKECKVHYL